jgi:hypothetical protein
MNDPSPPDARRDRREWVGLIQACPAAIVDLTTPATNLPESRQEKSSVSGNRRTASNPLSQPDPTEGGNHDPI